MANTSDGKGDPPDPPNDYAYANGIPPNSSHVPSANNNSIPTDINQDLLNNHHSDNDQHQSDDHDDDDMEFYDSNTDPTNK